MTCKHTPKFSFKLLIARKPELICRRCGVALEMTSSTYTVNRVLNGLLINLIDSFVDDCDVQPRFFEGLAQCGGAHGR